MKPTKISVYELFHRERRYVVPLYQRAYVWTQEDQWEPLWEDIQKQADDCLAASAHDYMPKRTHFLGAVVLNVERIVGSEVARSEVIDGQQRLTTFQLFLAALRDYAAEVEANEAGRIARLTRHEDEKPGSEGFFKVWPTNADRDEFRATMSAGSVADVQGDAKASELKPIRAAYVFFSQAIRGYVDQDGAASADMRERKINVLLQAMRMALHFVLIELEDSDDPQVIFETLNARGQPLLPSDLIRNYVFMQATRDRTLDSAELYQTYWHEFDNRRVDKAENGEDRFWHMPERQGRLIRPRIDLFIFHYLILKTGEDMRIGELFSEFRDWREAKPTPLLEFLSDLRSYSKIFATLILPQGNDRIARLARRIRTLDTSTVYPLLLLVLGFPAEKLPPEGRTQILGDLESWLVRRMVCQSTNKNYNRFFVQLLNKCKQAGEPSQLPNIVREELTRSSDPTLNWPDDREFLQGWLTKPVYVGSRPDRSAMLLRALEERLRTSKNEAMVLPDRLTVEHLLPQRGRIEDYPYASPMPVEGDEPVDRCRRRMVDTIGNLTLLTQELNSSVSNGAFGGKVKAIAAESDLRLNAWLRGGAVGHWDEADIEARGRKLVDLAILEWPVPPEVNARGSVQKAATTPSESEPPRSVSKQDLTKCRVNGESEVYGSVYKAFVVLGLDQSKHQAFRYEIKRTSDGTKIYEEDGKSYRFELVENTEGTEEKLPDLTKIDEDRIDQWIVNYEEKGATRGPLYFALLEERAKRDRAKGYLDVDRSLAALIQAARDQRYVTYGDLAKANDMEWKVARHRMNGKGGHLDRLVDVCHARQLPQLSAICVNESGRKTGELEAAALKGFVAAARRIGLPVQDDLAFHHQERDECFRWGREGKK